MTRFLSDWGLLVGALLSIGVLALVRIRREARARRGRLGPAPTMPLDETRLPIPLARPRRRMDRIALPARLRR